jgi:hypothetical protein
VTIEECNPGVRVRYVPFHADGDITHRHCEDGVVVRKTNAVVFVRFGVEGTTEQACSPEMLVAL